MTYIIDPTNALAPADTDPSLYAAAELRALKSYISNTLISINTGLLANGASPVTLSAFMAGFVALTGASSALSDLGISAAWQSLLSGVANTTGMKNRIINGACNKAQRAALVCSTGVSGYGGPDRFMAVNGNSAGGSFTQSQGSLTYNSKTLNTVLQTVNTVVSSLTGTNWWSGIYQIIEGLNCYDLLGQTITISFLYQTNVSGTYSIALLDGTSSNSYVSTFTAVAGTPEAVSLTVTLPTTLALTNNNASGLRILIGALNTVTYQQTTGNLNTWQSGNFISAQGATNWATTISNYIEVTNLQIEQSPIATLFEVKPFGVEDFLCYRYFYKHAAGTSSTYYCAGTGRAYNTTNGQIFFPLPAPMRQLPALSYSALTDWNPAGGIITAMSISQYDADCRSVTLDITASPFVNGQSMILNANGTTNASLSFNAELI